jgi:hypothetical protein
MGRQKFGEDGRTVGRDGGHCGVGCRIALAHSGLKCGRELIWIGHVRETRDV